MTIYDVLWRFMSREQRDGNCHKMSQIVVKWRKLSWRLSQIVVTFFFPSPSRRPLLAFTDLRQTRWVLQKNLVSLPCHTNDRLRELTELCPRNSVRKKTHWALCLKPCSPKPYSACFRIKNRRSNFSARARERIAEDCWQFGREFFGGGLFLGPEALENRRWAKGSDANGVGRI